MTESGYNFRQLIEENPTFRCMKDGDIRTVDFYRKQCSEISMIGSTQDYQMGSEYLISLQRDLILQQQKLIEIMSAKLGKSGKTESEEIDLRSLNKRTKYIKIILLVSLALTVVVGIIFTAIFYTQRHEESADDDVPSDPGDNGDSNIGNHQILDRTQWNGRAPIRIRNITAPVPLVVIKHTGGGMCYTFRVCAGKLQTIQSQAVGDGADDIYYNFLIGGDENIYVGRGWDVQPAQRDNIIDIAFMGSFTFDVPTAGMIEAAKLLIEDGAQKGKLTEDYKVVCHSQTEATESPGLHLIEEVKTWPHYDSGSYRSRSLKASSKSSARGGGS